MGKESEKVYNVYTHKYLCIICITESLYFTPETNMIVQINNASIKKNNNRCPLSVLLNVTGIRNTGDEHKIFNRCSAHNTTQKHGILLIVTIWNWVCPGYQNLAQISWAQDGRVEGCVLISCENSKIATRSWWLQSQPSTGECWIPPKKDAPGQRTKEKPQQDGKRGEIMFTVKPYTHQRYSEGSNKALCTPGPRDPQILSQTGLWSVWMSPAEARLSSGLPQGEGLWQQQTWDTQRVAWALLEEVSTPS